MKRYLFFVIATALLFNGCANKHPKPQVVQKIIHIKKDKPYKFTYKPVIGTQNPDEKISVDMGVVLRVWINSYKDRDGSLVASHDTYIWAKKPDFIVGAPLPVIKRGLVTSSGKIPFMLSNQEVDRSNFQSNENIKKYVNAIYEKSDKQRVKKRMNQSKKFDKEIKEYLEKRK